ncbi:MAG: class I SAM-dependent methyltransferase [Gammaproteobacteria bacterium]
MQTHIDLPKVYLSYPQSLQEISKARRLRKVVTGLILFPLYWGMAYFIHAPGLAFRRFCALMGIRLLLKGRDVRRAYNLIVSPMDSVRYFEFDFIWRTITKRKFRSYLDVSSPRLFPLIVVDRTPGLVATLINPDKKDLLVTTSWAKSFGLADRCRFYGHLINDVPFEPNSFEVITSISVIEHIPEDKRAIQKMWDLLKPGGQLVISVPCAAKASEEYINLNEYELINTDENGFVFWQRYYDENLIEQRIFSVTGKPNSFQIYGEKQANSYNQDVERKRTDPFYPYWREPYMMGMEYELTNQISELPGMGVIAMEFVKPN